MEKMKSASDLEFGERRERIHVVSQSGHGILGAVMSEAAVSGLVEREGQPSMVVHIETVDLYRPSLAPVYGGPTLLEALWSEMDRLMEALMTGAENDEDVCGKKSNCEWASEDSPCQHEDNGDKYRAQELAWVLAIVTDPYEPSVDKIRAKAMERWKAAEADADAQNPDGDR